MTGDDYNDDGEIDFFREADSPGRTLNRSYVKIKNKWHETNIVGAYLVSSFLPYNDGASVKPHDVDLLMNGKLVSSRTNIIPTGSTIRKLRVDYFNENHYGISRNKITVSTKHLPDANYQVNSENTLVLYFFACGLDKEKHIVSF
jgi:hypothetical protein